MKELCLKKRIMLNFWNQLVQIKIIIRFENRYSLRFTYVMINKLSHRVNTFIIVQA